MCSSDLISTNANTVWIGRQNRGTYSYDFYGHIDDVQFYDRALSEAEILAIYSNQTNVTVAQETRGGEVWKACITPNDGYEDGTEVCSNNVTVAPIAVVNVTVNSTRGTNLTTENLTANYVLANGSDRAIINWYRNGTSITVLNMPFEGGSNTTWAKDYSGYGNNGSVTTLANPPYVPWLADGGYDGKGAYNFSLGYISIADSNSLDVTGYALTLEAWVYPRALTNFNAIVGKEDNDCSDDYWIYQFEGATDVINFRVATDISGRTGVASSALSANQWYYVVGTYDGATLRLYINGVLNNSADKTGTIETSTGPFSIGKYQGCNKDQFNGIVDNVRVYNKTLSPEQILAIYNNRTDMILSNETAAGDNWSACITPNDGTLDGSEACSNNLTIVSNNPPTQGTPILNSTLGTNLTTENLTVYNQ